MVAQTTSSSPPHTLSAMRDRSRPLLIFAPPGDSRLDEQMHLLTSHRAELIDRQVVLIPASQKPLSTSEGGITTPMGNEEAVLRGRFHVANDGFTVLLLGKDGGEKFRAHAPVTIEQLIQLIDAMPMRRQEMQSHPPH